MVKQFFSGAFFFGFFLDGSIFFSLGKSKKRQAKAQKK